MILWAFPTDLERNSMWLLEVRTFLPIGVVIISQDLDRPSILYFFTGSEHQEIARAEPKAYPHLGTGADSKTLLGFQYVSPGYSPVIPAPRATTHHPWGLSFPVP